MRDEMKIGDGVLFLSFQCQTAGHCRIHVREQRALSGLSAIQTRLKVLRSGKYLKKIRGGCSLT